MNSSIPTLVFGASLNSDRYSNMAIKALRRDGHKTIGIGLRPGNITDVDVLTGHPALEDIHTISMYMGEKRQKEHESYLLALHPKRIIFNPGAENPALFAKAKTYGIEVINACTLVMLATGDFIMPESNISTSV